MSTYVDINIVIDIILTLYNISPYRTDFSPQSIHQSIK